LKNLLAIAAVLLLGLPLWAQAPRLQSVRVGLPAGNVAELTRTRNTAWTPVAITLRADVEPVPAGKYRLWVESADAEALPYQYPLDVPEMPARAERVVMAYAVPGADQKDFSVRLETTEGRLLQVFPAVERDPLGILREQEVLFTALGVGYTPLKRAVEKPDFKENAEADAEADRRKFAFLTEVAQLPDRWFGYAATDVVILSTRDDAFIQKFVADEAQPQRDALLEWVRRGGQLLLPIGIQRQRVAKDLLPKWPIVDVKVEGSEALRTLPSLSLQWAKLGGQKAALQNIEVTRLAPGPMVSPLVRDGGQPILLQASCGLGRVLVLAFDLEDPAVTAWEGYPVFWNKLQQDIAPLVKRAAGGHAGVFAPRDDRNDLADRLKLSLETFEEITPISFGYVALFLALYILVVGPLDYFVLKRVFKRLEWTWVSFPLTVLFLSAVAYFAAYQFKGVELRTNKLDLIDIDLHEPRSVIGHTWVTLFSPQVQAYTVGIEPNTADWFGPIAPQQPGLMMQLLEANEPPRTGQQTSFTRPYLFAHDAQGMEKVPVPVWSTRSFAASWRAPLGEKAPIGITDDAGPVRAASNGRVLVGRLTNQMPGVELTGIGLLYRDRWYNLDRLAPGESIRLEPFFAQDAKVQGKRISEWFADEALRPGEPLRLSDRPLDAQIPNRQMFRLAQEMMFFQALGRADQHNAGLRGLDQSWRLPPLAEFPPVMPPRYRQEAILVARTRLLCDEAERVNAHPANPSRLWLGKLPHQGGERPALSGVLTQETFLRVFIPVAN
jgi:hypothetical protein